MFDEEKMDGMNTETPSEGQTEAPAEGQTEQSDPEPSTGEQPQQ